MGKITAFLVILFISLYSAYADDIIVGGSNGWTNNFDYGTWAAAQTFTTSDTLVFNYGPSHALNEVSKSDYDNCNPSNSITSASSSPSRISLASTTGTRYFICPRSNHCLTGMKLAVTVSSGAGSTTPTSPSSGNPTTTPGTPATAGSPPPPPYSAAVRSGGEGFVAGLLVLVMGALMG